MARSLRRLCDPTHAGTTNAGELWSLAGIHGLGESFQLLYCINDTAGAVAKKTRK